MKIVTKSEWMLQDMPKKTECFSLVNDLSAIEVDQLKRGHIPQEMEDKWFSYFEDNKLYVHRSWSGICIFIVEFCGDELKVTANRDKKQYRGQCVEEDKEYLHSLLHGVLRWHSGDEEIDEGAFQNLKPATESRDLLNKALELFEEAKKMK